MWARRRTAAAASLPEGQGPEAAAGTPSDSAARVRPAATVQPMPSLQALCTALLVKHIDAVSAFGAVPAGVLARVQAALCRRRALSPSVLPLFSDPLGAVSELVLDDCSLLAEVRGSPRHATDGAASTARTARC